MKRDEVIVEIETDKVVLEVPALSDGVLAEVVQAEGKTVVSKQLLGKISTAQEGDVSSATLKQRMNPHHQIVKMQRLKIVIIIMRIRARNSSFISRT